MPNHNYALYIDEAIESVKKQSFEDWELIIIDDGSTDNSREILEKYKKEGKITVLEQENQGLNITNNVAIRLAGGEYIVRVDADDYLDENFLLVLSNILDTKKEIGLVFPDYYHVDKKGNILEQIRRKKLGEESTLLDLPAHGACTMFRTEVLREIGSYNEDFTCQDGYDIWLKFIEQHKPYNVHVPLFYYRQHQENLTQNSQKILDTRMGIKDRYLKDRGGLKLKILGFIPATSSSIYKQNDPFVEINGKPLIWYTLSQAFKSSSLSKVAVSSEDSKVLSYVEENFPESITLKRRNETSSFGATNIVIVQELISAYEDQLKDFDAICLLPISTPLRKFKHIDHAASTMQVFNVDTVKSIEEEISPFYQHTVNGLEPINVTSENQPRLERDSLFRDNSAITLTKLRIIKDGKILGNKIGHITMLKEESIKINSDFELWMVKEILSRDSKDALKDEKK